MKTEIEKAMKALISKIDKDIESTDAQRITQSVVNLMHVHINARSNEKEDAK